MILLMRTFSRTLASVLIRLIGRYLATSLLVSFPGLIIGIIIAVFHRLGKQAVLRQPLYNAVVDLGSRLKVQ
jgi:hypothetical protein